MLESLQGLRILSLAEQYPGPYATSLLADLGAEVVLVERPPRGDPSRRFANHFEELGRNKKSVALNLKTASGRRAFFKLVDTAGVVVEGFRPGVVDRLGISAQQVHRRRSDLIYLSISGFGQDGPWHRHAVHDLGVQAAAGALHSPDGQPEFPRLPLADMSAAMFTTIGVLAGLLERAITGRGCYIDVSMLDSLASWMAPWITAEMNGGAPLPHPPPDPGYGLFATADGSWVALSIAGEDHLWAAACDALELGELSSLTETMRIARAEEISAQLREAFKGRTALDLSETFNEHGISLPLCHGPRAVAANPQAQARKLLARRDANTDDDARWYVRQPLVIDRRVARVRTPAPDVGEHTVALLREAGLSEGEVASMLQEGAAWATP